MEPLPDHPESPAGAGVPAEPLVDRGIPVEPPADAEDWSDEQWIAYLEATDAGSHPSSEPFDPSTPMARFVRRPGPHVVGVAMKTLGEILYGRKDTPVAVQPGSGQGDDQEDFTVELDPENHVARVYFHEEEPREDGPPSAGEKSG